MLPRSSGMPAPATHSAPSVNISLPTSTDVTYFTAPITQHRLPEFPPVTGAMDATSSRAADKLSYEDEPPLLEELGINFGEIWSKTKSMMLLRNTGPVSADAIGSDSDDADLAGPLFFALALGFCLLLNGKIHFGYIYGFGLVGCVLLYTILNLMSNSGISFDRTVSILGYCLLPIILLAGVNVVVSLRSYACLIATLSAVGWCTATATAYIEQSHSMREQRYLVAYPVFLLYACFALLTIF